MFEVPDIGPEGFAHLGRVAGKVNHHAAGIDNVDFKALVLQPIRYCVQILLCHAVLLSKLLSGDPLMKIGRTLRMQFFQELLQGQFLLRRASQLEQHVVHRVVSVYRAAIILMPCFGSRIAVERDALFVIEMLRYENTRMTS